MLLFALTGNAIAATSLLSIRHAAAQPLQNSAAKQIQDAQADYAATQVDITRDFLTEFADNLKTLADFGSLLYGARDLKLPSDASPATQAFFARIQPMQNWLAGGGSEIPDQYDLLQKIYEVADAIRQDLARPQTDPMMAALSSHTLETLGGLGLDWVTNANVLQKLADTGKISQPFAKFSGFLSFGADDLAAGIAGGVGSGNWQDPETAAHLLDALNRGAWAAVGFLVSGGDREVADLFSSAAGFAGAFVRGHTVDMFATAYMKLGGFDQAILDQYVSAQQARVAHNQAPVSFEDFVGFDPEILRAIDPTQRGAADAMFGLHVPPSPPRDTTQVTVITRTTYDHYNEVCQSGFCVRTDLTSAPHSDPSGSADGRGGVKFDIKPTSAGHLEINLVGKVLGGQHGNAGVWKIQRQEGQ